MTLKIPLQLFLNAALAYDGTRGALDTQYAMLTNAQTIGMKALAPLAASFVCTFTAPYISFEGADDEALTFSTHANIDALVENHLIDTVAARMLAQVHNDPGLRAASTEQASNLATMARRLAQRRQRLDFRDHLLRPRWY